MINKSDQWVSPPTFSLLRGNCNNKKIAKIKSLCTWAFTVSVSVIIIFYLEIFADIFSVFLTKVFILLLLTSAPPDVSSVYHPIFPSVFFFFYKLPFFYMFLLDISEVLYCIVQKPKIIIVISQIKAIKLTIIISSPLVERSYRCLWPTVPGKWTCEEETVIAWEDGACVFSLLEKISVKSCCDKPLSAGEWGSVRLQWNHCLSLQDVSFSYNYIS